MITTEREKIMLKKSDLIDLGATEELADNVLKAISAEITGNFIPKSRFDEVNQAKKNAEELLKERDGQLDALKKSNVDLEQLRSEISKLQETNKTAEEEYKANIKKMQLDNAIDLALRDARAKNAKAVRSLLDMDGIKLDNDGVLRGLEEQLNKIQQSDGYLFDVVEQQSAAKITGYIPVDGREEIPDAKNATYQSRLNEARKNNDLLSAIQIKREAMADGVTLF